MKKLILLSCLFSHQLFATQCLNLKGRYQTSTGTQYVVEQNNCSKMTIKINQDLQEITFNLGPLFMGSEPIFSDGVQVGVKNFYLDSFLGLDEWIYKEREVHVYSDGLKNEFENKICVVSKEANRDLFTNCYHYNDQSVHQYTDKWLGAN